MFQEVKLVVDPLYLSLVPRDKDDEMDNMLKNEAGAIRKQSTIKVSDVEGVQVVQDIIFRVAGLQTNDKSAANGTDQTNNQNGHDNVAKNQKQDVSADGSVRPKTRSSKNISSTQNQRGQPSHLSTNYETDEDKKSDSDRMSTEEGETRDRYTSSSRTTPQYHSSRMAPSFSNQGDSSGDSNSDFGNTTGKRDRNTPNDHADGSDVASTKRLHASSDSTSSNEPPQVGPLSVSTLLFQYLIEKQSNDVDRLSQKYGIKVIHKPDSKQGGQGEVYILCDDKLARRCSAKDMKTAGEEFVDLYQACFQRVLISRPVVLNGIETQKSDEAVRLISARHPFVLVDDKIDDEVTFVGEETEVAEAIKSFQTAIGLQPKSRRLKQTPESSSSLYGNESHTIKSNPVSASAGWKKVPSKSKGNEFHTVEGIRVIAQKDDIVKQDVDVIVNAANTLLTHGSGVAGALRSAAGQELQNECNEITRNRRDRLKETDCVYSKGYNLSCQFVIHAIGPMYNTEDTENVFFVKLQETFLNCFALASHLRAKSIALPLVSSGAFDGPKELCARALVSTIRRYSRMEKNNTIDTMILVNKDDDATDAILKQLNWLQDVEDDDQMEISSDAQTQRQSKTGTHNAYFWKEKVLMDGNTAANSSMLQESRTNSQGARPHTAIATKRMVYVNGKVRTIIEQKHIFEAAKIVDCIIVPTDDMLCFNKGIAKEVAEATELNKESLKDKTGGFVMNVGEILHADGLNLGNIDKIIFVVAPEEWNFSNHGSPRQSFHKKLQEVVCNSMKYADSLRLQNVALPLFPQDAHLKELCADAFAAAIRQFTDIGPKYTRQIHIVNDDGESNMALQVAIGEAFQDLDSDYLTAHASGASGGTYALPEDLDDDAHHSLGPNKKHNQQGSLSKQLDKHSASPEKGEDSDSDEGNEEDKKCPICLEEFSTSKPPKDLDKCKHKFCKECWEEAMKHKPACPICGVLYGTMKGNQPPGRMDVSHSRYGSLPGYEGCGIITITYSFAGGKQGVS